MLKMIQYVRLRYAPRGKIFQYSQTEYYLQLLLLGKFYCFRACPLLPMPMHIRVDIFQCKLLNKVGSSQNPETVLYRCSYDKRRSENMPQIYRRKAMRKYDLNILAKQLY